MPGRPVGPWANSQGNVQGTAHFQGMAPVSAQREQQGGEQLVSVRREVLNDAEHAVGNLLQRMHHAARAARSGLGAQGERLQSALDDLERVLELLFDYVSPVEVQVRPIDAGRIAESLLAQLRAQGAAELAPGELPAVQVLADPRVLSRSFLLLALACTRDGEAGAPLVIETVPDTAGDRVAFLLRAADETPTAAAAYASLAAAVAARLIELQGGELHARAQPGCPWSVVLPLAS